MNAPLAQTVVSTRGYQKPAGELVLTQSDFERISKILHEETGIALPPSKSQLVSSRLAKRMRALGLKRFEDYCQLVSSGEDSPELGHMIAALTTNVTRFFREMHHFDHLKTNVLPKLIEDAKARKRVRIWSAACSSGEEPYSIAFTLLSQMPDAASYDVKILATDIDPVVVERAKAGIYSKGDLEDLPDGIAKRFFSPAPSGDADGLMVSEAARQLVTFKQLNLIRPWPMSGPFQAVFCRNVVIYFDEPTKQELWARLGQILSPAGTLYVGHSERVSGSAEKSLSPDGVTTYRKVTGERT